MERISALNAESKVGETRVWRGERKVGKYLDTIPDLGKHRKLRKSPKNEVVRKASQKFSKIINIIKRFLVKSVFRNSISFSK